MTEVIETSLAVPAQAAPLAVGRSYAELERMAHTVVTSRLFGIATIEQAIVLMMVAEAEGMHPVDAFRQFYVVNGRPVRSAESMLAKFQQRGGHVEWLVYTADVVTGRFTAKNGDTVDVTWDSAKANRAGLLGKDNWKKNPESMRASRCISEGVRRVDPGCVLGIYIADEAEEMEPRYPATPRGEQAELEVITAETYADDEPEVPYSTPEERQAQRAAHEAQNQHLPKRVTEQNKQRSYNYKDVRVEMLGGGTMYPDADKPCTVIKVLHRSKEICLTHYKHPSELVARIKAAGYPDVYDPTQHKGPITVDIVATPDGKEWRYVASNLRVEPAPAAVPAPELVELAPAVTVEEITAEMAKGK